MRRILTFLKSLSWHIWLGFPKSTQKQIDERYDTCSSCEYHEKTLQQCLVCGCNVNRKSIFMNKLAWADQECPIGKWKKLI